VGGQTEAMDQLLSAVDRYFSKIQLNTRIIILCLLADSDLYVGRSSKFISKSFE
jgi:hypothetical protein